MYKFVKVYLRVAEDVEDKLDFIDTYFSTLYMNGQILSWDIYGKQEGEEFVAVVEITDDDALEEKYNLTGVKVLTGKEKPAESSEANSYWEKYAGKLNMRYEVLADSALATDCCHCEKHSGYILYAEHDMISSPVYCVDCGDEIPLFRLPHLFDDKEHYAILTWQETYNAVEELWVNSLSDRFTRRQLCDPNSELNKQGVEICKELEKKLQAPVYLFCRCASNTYFGSKRKRPPLSVCPKCGGELTPFANQDLAEKACETCRLAFEEEDK